jgi:hypothetical protein
MDDFRSGIVPPLSWKRGAYFSAKVDVNLAERCSMTIIHAYQNFHDETSRRALDPGFLPLDNTAQERPDWWEYWPIRKFLLGQGLEEDAFYGFFSAKLKSKVNLTAEQVHEFIRACPADTDVVLFSPHVHLSAHFWNVFLGGDAHHPGLLDVSRRFLASIGYDADLNAIVSDSTNTIFSNYFAAKPRFWRAWLAINEAMFKICETPDHPLSAALNAKTLYRGQPSVQMKIFVMERIATLILCTDPSFKACAHNPFLTRKRAYKLPFAILCDALKIGYRTTGFWQYKRMFRAVASTRRFGNLVVRIAGGLHLYRSGSDSTGRRDHA